VPLSADAEGSLGIKPRRDVNAAAHCGVANTKVSMQQQCLLKALARESTAHKEHNVEKYILHVVYK